MINLLYRNIINMKIICDWENCNEIGSYKAPQKKTTVGNLGYYV